MKCLILVFVLSGCSLLAGANELSIEKTIALAINNDSWLEGSRLRETAYRNEAVSHSTLPDPSVSIGLANLPIDSWDFDQENMTQFTVGITQRFPSGNTRVIKARKSGLMADINPMQRQERIAQLTQRVSHLWLDSYFAKQSITLIEKDRNLFEQLVEVTTARYESTVGKARQQDVVRAQLELTKLEDRLIRLHMQYDMSRQLLAEWVPVENHTRPLKMQLPDLALPGNLSNTLIMQHIKRHPKLLIADKQIEIRYADIALEKQAYKPGWALNASYGYRDDSTTGLERSDFFSVGVSFDLPVFTKNRQDRSVSAAEFRQEAVSLDYQLLERKLLSKAYKTLSELERLKQQSDLYQEKLLQQMREQADASLSAYTNDDGDFADVMRAYIAELNTKIEALEIKVNYRKASATMNYLMAGPTVSDYVEWQGELQ